jgi:hypothetical protein
MRCGVEAGCVAPRARLMRARSFPDLPRRSFFDFEGRTDARSLRDYLRRVAPRRLAVLRGSPAARAELAAAAAAELADYGTAVLAPGPPPPVRPPSLPHLHATGPVSRAPP